MILSIFIHSNALAATGNYHVWCSRTPMRNYFSFFAYWDFGDGCPNANFTVYAYRTYNQPTNSTKAYATFDSNHNENIYDSTNHNYGPARVNLFYYNPSRGDYMWFKINGTLTPRIKQATINGESYYGTFYVSDHTLGGWESDDNNHYEKCTRCGKTTNSGAHTWSDYTIENEPTCETPGSKYRTCTVCGRKQAVKIAALGHTYDIEWSMNETHHYHLCLRCGAKGDEALHNFVYLQQSPTVDAELTFETGDLTVYGGEGSKSQAYTYTGDGEISVASSNTDVATASVNENTVTVEYVKPGTSTITVSAPKTKKFNEISQTFEVTCEKTKLTIPSLSGTYFETTGQWVGPQVYNFDGNTMTQSGTTRASTPGDYVVQWNLKDTNKYCWADGTTGAKTVGWNVTVGNINVHLNYYYHPGALDRDEYAQGDAYINIQYGQTWIDVVNSGKTFNLNIT